MAYFKFVDAIANDRPIEVYNHGKMRRDFTYVDDVVEGIIRTAQHPPDCTGSATGTSSKAFFKVYNIGNNNPIELLEFIKMIESAMGKKAKMVMKPMQPGDVVETYADIEELQKDMGFSPCTSIGSGISKFVEWYKESY